ncbi:MAG: TRAP transporter small permease [Thermovirgaceae bacterium]
MFHNLSEAIGIFLEKYLVPFLMMSLFVLVFFQVLNRFILHIPIAWTEEFGRYAFVWVSLLGAAEAARKGEHLNVTFFQDLVGGSGKKVMVVISELLSIVFFGFLVYQGFSWTLRNGFKVMADSFRLPMFYIQVIVPISATFVVLFVADRLFYYLMQKRNEVGK